MQAEPRSNLWRGRTINLWLAVLLGVTLFGRLLLAAFVGLGVDESYTVSTAKTFALSTFDHPPLAWWMARLGRMIGRSSHYSR
jgi:hypothetical protein